jgi:hypothetical protein
MKPGGEFSSRSKIAATIAAVVLAFALGYVDYVTGRDLAISAFYLLPISLAAWVAGRWWGFFVGALCTCLAFFSDTLSGPAYEHPLIPVWNAVMLLVFFIIVSWLLTDFRRSHYQLEQTVAHRTAALKSQIEERKQLEQVRRTLGLQHWPESCKTDSGARWQSRRYRTTRNGNVCRYTLFHRAHGESKAA